MQSESVYSYAVPNPNITTVRRAMWLSLAGPLFALAALWYVDWRGIADAPTLLVLLLFGTLVVYAISTMAVPAFASFSFRRGKVLMTPEWLILNPWGSTKEIRWQDIMSVSSDRYEGRSFAERMLRGNKNEHCVVVTLRRPRFGLTMWGTDFFVLYLRNQEQFVQEAQQHLVAP